MSLYREEVSELEICELFHGIIEVDFSALEHQSSMRLIIDDLFIQTKAFYLLKLAFFLIFYALFIILLFIRFPHTKEIWEIKVATFGITVGVVSWEALTLLAQGVICYFEDPWNYLDILLIAIHYIFTYLICTETEINLEDQWR